MQSSKEVAPFLVQDSINFRAPKEQPYVITDRNGQTRNIDNDQTQKGQQYGSKGSTG
jgi:hypothetical protein